VDNILAFIRFNILGFAFGAHIVAAATPNVSPFCAVKRAPIVIDVLLFGHKSPWPNATTKPI
jgi:hypothetical protein